MIKFALLISLAFVANGSPITKGANIFTYQDNNGNIVSEDLDAPPAVVFAVDINKQKFMLYTQSNVETAFELKNKNPTLLNQSPFNPKVPTKVLIHGWQNNYQTESMQLIKNAYLARGAYNVLVCDYEEYNSPYLSAQGSAKTLGSNIGEFLSFLIKNGLKAADIHIIGHSLGAHIAGFAARSISGVVIPHITALDAAGPLYNNKGPKDRLDSSDAEYVEAVHTSAQFGMTNPVGNVNFYPHGGDKQPVCLHAAISSGCDHATSYRYWTTSIPDHVSFPAYSCKTVADAQDFTNAAKKCTLTSSVMGDNAYGRTPPGIYYINVTKEESG